MAKAISPANERRTTYLANGHAQMAAELKECGAGLLPHTRKETDLHRCFKGLDINVLQHTHTHTHENVYLLIVYMWKTLTPK